MKSKLFATLLMASWAFVTSAAEYPELNIPANGGVKLQGIPRLGEEVLGGLLTSRIGEGATLQPYFGNTRVCVVAGLWECHTWFNDDGTGVEFWARKKSDGSVELASTIFWYRVAGQPGDYHLCRRLSADGKETCEAQKWEEGHYLYDEWFNNYDRPAETGFPAYKNVHEHYSIIPGRR